MKISFLFRQPQSLPRHNAMCSHTCRKHLRTSMLIRETVQHVLITRITLCIIQRQKSEKIAICFNVYTHGLKGPR